nr:PatB family C-S lyase [Candidatus Cloacimonadota bacterium]
QTPVYFPFFVSIQNNGRELVNSQLKLIGNRYEIDFDDLAKQLRNNVKMMIFCSPHNPVGRVWSREELQQVAELCLENQVLLISDEIHSDLILNGYKHIPTASLSAVVAQNTISMFAPSKTFNVAGLATSAIVIPDPEKRKKFQDFMENLGLHMINLFGISAFTAAYREGEEWLEQMLIYLEGNYHFVRDYLQKNIPQIKTFELEGTYLMWLDCRALHLEPKELTDFFIEKAGLALNDGSSFGAGGEGFMRLNIGCPRSILQKALEQLKAAIEEI